MPVREDGRWESWATRNAREKEAAAAVVVDEPEAEAPEELTRGQKAARTRAANSASKAAREGAIADATGIEVTLDGDSETESTEDESESDDTTEADEPGEGEDAA